MALSLYIRSTITALSLLSVLSLDAANYNFRWDGGGSNAKFENPGNWSTHRVPTQSGKNTASVLIDNGTVIFDDLTGPQKIDQIDVINGAVLNVKGGLFDIDRAGNVIRSSVGIEGGNLSAINQSGGHIKFGQMLRIGQKNSQGQYNLTDGILEIHRGGRNFINEGQNVSVSLGAGDSKSELNVNGGTLKTRVGVEIGSEATFAIAGSAPKAIEIGTVQARDAGNWYQQGTLSCKIDRRGITPIYVAPGELSDPFVRFVSGSKLDLSFHNAPPKEGSWVILEVDGAAIEDEGLALSEASRANGSWSFFVDNSGPNGRLIATYGKPVGIPEPMNYALIVSAVLTLGLFGGRKYAWRSASRVNLR